MSDSIPGGVPGGGIGEAPKPGRSNAITSRSGSSRLSTGCHICQWLPIPWISTKGGPVPERW